MRKATDDEVREYLAERDLGSCAPGCSAFELARAIVEMLMAGERAFEALAQLKPITTRVRTFSPEFLAEMAQIREGR